MKNTHLEEVTIKKQNTLVRMMSVMLLLAITAFACSWLKRARNEAQLGADIDGEAVDDYSGWAVSLSADGSIVAIGAGGNDGTGNDAGHVRVYQYANGMWVQLGADIDGEATGDDSGHSVSLSADGSIVAIGASENDGTGSDAGHVRVYQYANGAWVQLGADIDGETVGDWSGLSVSLSADGSIVAIGAPYNDSTTGHVRVYQYAREAWVQLGADIDGEAMGDNSGGSVSLSADGSIVAIGAVGNDGTGDAAGHVRIYQYTDKAWVQLGADIDGEAAGDMSGWSVSLSADGSIVAIGASGKGGASDSIRHVRVYQYVSGAWVQLGADIDGEEAGDASGHSVSLSADGSIVAIGAPANRRAAGHVRVYQYTDGAWTQIGADIDGEAAGDNSGYCVSLSSDGSIVAIGAPLNSGTGSKAGHVRVYTTSATPLPPTETTIPPIATEISHTDTPLPPTETPICSGLERVQDEAQLGADIDGEAAGDVSGHSVSLSSDGSIVAIGAYMNNGTGFYAGHVRVYQVVCGAWVQLGADIDGEMVEDESGWSVSLSADGSIVAIGARNNDGTGNHSGHVRVYQYVDRAWVQMGADIDGEAAGDMSGHSVSLSADGSIVAIGAPWNDGTGDDAGHVRVYQYASSAWVQLGADIDGETAGDESGYSVSLSADGSIVAIGAITNDGTGDYAGHVRVYQYTSGTWVQMGADIDGEAAEDWSGYSVSLSADGSIVAVGADGNDGTGDDAGHVRVYQYVGGAWVQLGNDIDGEVVEDHSGYSVSLSADGSIVAIGAPLNGFWDTGHVRIYQYSGGVWVQLGADIDGEAEEDWSGLSVSLSADGSIVAIGAPGNDVSGSKTGHVRVYTTSSIPLPPTDTPVPPTPTEIPLTDTPLPPTETPISSGLELAQYEAQLGADIDGEAAGDRSGWSVSLSADGSIVAIGAHDNDGTGNRAGHVRVYQYVGGGWVQLGVDIDGEAAGDCLGSSVSLSADGSIVAIGARGNGGTGYYAGHVRVYQYTSGAWVQLGTDIDGEAVEDQSGFSVSLSADGSIVVIGAPGNNVTGEWTGHARVYQYESGAWVQLGADIDGEAAFNLSGASVSLSADGSIVAIGAPGNNEATGLVRVYQYLGGTWVQLGADIEGEAMEDQSASVSLSADGSIVAIGATGNDGTGSDAGHVRVYQYADGTWVQLGSDIDGEAAEDYSGSSVSLSADGSILAIGGPWNDGTGSDAGHVRVYQYLSGAWVQLGVDIDGEAAGDVSGSSVSLSADGSILAIGAPHNGGTGDEAGHVRVYGPSATEVKE